jgi:hypothetical protein
MLMPSPTGPGLNSAFSPYTDSPSSPANFNQVFSNRCISPALGVHTARTDGFAQIFHAVRPPDPAPEPVPSDCRPVAC